MGTTTNYDWPYPEGSDDVIEGDDAMQALGVAIDATLAWSSGVVIARAESASSTGVVDFPGTQALMEDFTYSAGVLTYTGPGRLFQVDVEVEMITGAGTSTSSAIELRLNGASFVGSNDEASLTSGAFGVRKVSHRVTTALVLQTSETIDVVASGTPSATVGIAGIRVYPLGPVLP